MDPMERRLGASPCPAPAAAVAAERTVGRRAEPEGQALSWSDSPAMHQVHRPYVGDAGKVKRLAAAAFACSTWHCTVADNAMRCS